MTWRRWAYGKEDRRLRDVFDPLLVGIVIAIAIVAIGIFGLWR